MCSSNNDSMRFPFDVLLWRGIRRRPRNGEHRRVDGHRRIHTSSSLAVPLQKEIGEVQRGQESFQEKEEKESI